MSEKSLSERVARALCDNRHDYCDRVHPADRGPPCTCTEWGYYTSDADAAIALVLEETARVVTHVAVPDEGSQFNWKNGFVSGLEAAEAAILALKEDKP